MKNDALSSLIKTISDPIKKYFPVLEVPPSEDDIFYISDPNKEKDLKKE